MPLCLSMCVAEESTSLSPTPFANVELKDIRYDEVYGTGMVEGGSEVSIKVVLTNVSKEIDESTFSFQSELVGAGGHVSVDDRPAEALQSGSSYTLNHKKVIDKVVISWSGEAPEVWKQERFMLLNVTQETTEGVYSVKEIKKDVTSQTIEDVIIAVNKAREEIANANEAIANAEEAGLNVAGARVSLALANEHLNNSQQYYNEGRSEEALEEANKALNSAKDAEAKAGSAVGGVMLRNYAIIAVVAVVVIIVFVLLLQQRRRKRGVY
jgi:tetratricopeptide (TPR) repeat protein